MHYLFFILTFFACKSNMNLKAGNPTSFTHNQYVDTSKLVKEYRGCKLHISSGISNNATFSNMLSQDTVIICYFREKVKKPVSIYINNIEFDPANHNVYLFTIFFSPLGESEKDKLKRVLAGAARDRYRISTTIGPYPSGTKITGIQFIGHPIEM